MAAGGPVGGRRVARGERGLRVDARVLQQPLDRDHHILHLGGLSDRPLEEAGEPDQIDERRAEQARVGRIGADVVVAGERGAEDAEDEHRRADRVEAEAEPPTERDERKVGARVGVVRAVELGEDEIVDAKGADRHDALE